MTRWNGGVIGVANNPTSSSANGIWSLSEMQKAVRGGNWPLVVSGYQIQRSLRFNPGDTPYLSRTFGSTTDRQKWTWSGWVKRVATGAVHNLMFVNNGSAGTPRGGIGFLSGDTFTVTFNTGGSSWDIDLVTTQVFRDVSAWYHIVVAVDTTQATSSNRIKLYVNGSQVTAFSTATYPSQNTNTPFNTTYTYILGATDTTQGMLNGYLTEVNYIDGQALTPSSFGQTNSSTGVWEPIAFSGTYGTNGFYLNFSDNSGTTSTTLGKDYSGNSNNWTPNNFSVTAGAGNDSLVDTPTPYGTDTGAGGEVRGNYCTLNPLSTTSGTYTQGNLRYTGPSSSTRSNGTIAVSTGKWYWEVTLGNAPDTRSSSSAYNAFGFGLSTVFAGSGGISGVTDAVILADNGYYKNFSGSWTDGGTAFSNGDTLSIAVDLDSNSYTLRRNNTQVATGTIGGTAGRELVPIIISYSGSFGVMDCNFGQRPFAYTAPSGYKALCAQNLPTPAVGATSTTQANDYFNIVTYTGNGTGSRSITGVGFQPDFVWIKNRASGSVGHRLYDAIRGTTKELYSHSDTTEYTETQGLTAFGSDGFTVGTSAGVNENSSGIVAWNWFAGGTNATNTNGTITSTVRANTTSGFSILTFTSQASGTATVGHGLGVVPKFYVVKTRGVTDSWRCYHASLGAANEVILNSTAASASTSDWNSTAPTSTVISIGSPYAGSYSLVAYCFAEVAGFSAFGSYTGNGSTNGTFVYTGFRPKYVMIKRTDVSNDWEIWDATRNTYNVANLTLAANLADAEYTRTTSDLVDLLSNGFKVRASNAALNASSGGYIYVAFAEAPFKYSLAR